MRWLACFISFLVVFSSFLFSILDKDTIKAQRQAAKAKKDKEEDDFLEWSRNNPPDHSQHSNRKGRKK
jgi:hypothetical protein